MQHRHAYPSRYRHAQGRQCHQPAQLMGRLDEVLLYFCVIYFLFFSAKLMSRIMARIDEFPTPPPYVGFCADEVAFLLSSA